MVHRDGEMFALRCCRCLKDRKPAQWKWNGLTVGQVQKQVCAVEVHINRSAFHSHVLSESHPPTIGCSGVAFKEGGRKRSAPALKCRFASMAPISPREVASRTLALALLAALEKRGPSYQATGEWSDFNGHILHRPRITTPQRKRS